MFGFIFEFIFYRFKFYTLIMRNKFLLMEFLVPILFFLLLFLFLSFQFICRFVDPNNTSLSAYGRADMLSIEHIQIVYFSICHYKMLFFRFFFPNHNQYQYFTKSAKQNEKLKFVTGDKHKMKIQQKFSFFLLFEPLHIYVSVFAFNKSDKLCKIYRKKKMNFRNAQLLLNIKLIFASFSFYFQAK